MRDDLTDGFRYAVQPRLLIAYLGAFLGEFVRIFRLRPPGDLGEPIYGLVSFILGPFNFVIDLIGTFLVAISVVAVLWIVLSDALGDGSPDLPFGDDGTASGESGGASSTTGADASTDGETTDAAASTDDETTDAAASTDDETAAGTTTAAGDETTPADEGDASTDAAGTDDGPWTDE